MELKEFATRILSADTLEEKLLEPGPLTDWDPGSAIFWKEPTRPKNLQFQKHTKKDKLPKLCELSDKDKRAYCLHRFAGHELLAVEIMAYALLAFPNAPKHFRKGLANTLKEEQEHVRLYKKEMQRLGIEFGDAPVFKHFFSYTPHLKTPEEYVSMMSLTFEMANLDYAPTYRSAFLKHGDEKAALLMDRILEDEIAHVAFGWNWLKKMKPKEETMWQAFLNSLPESLSPKSAIGHNFQKEHRLAAGVSNEYVNELITLCEKS